MNYDGLEKDYWDSQVQRVERLRQKIAARAAIPTGRVIPDDTDLAIGTGRRLNLAIMFVDIVKFSNRRSITDTEQEMMLRVLNLFFTEMIRIVEDYGGIVEKNTGDGLMAYFEDRTEDGPGTSSVKRAVGCALTMTAANEHLISPVLRVSGVEPLQFRASIEHGAVTIARIGAPQRFNANVAIGNAANFASKMLKHVGADQIGLGATAREKLPVEWQTRWTVQSPVSTGWVRSNTNDPYPIFLYTGRWVRLI